MMFDDETGEYWDHDPFRPPVPDAVLRTYVFKYLPTLSLRACALVSKCWRAALGPKTEAPGSVATDSFGPYSGCWVVVPPDYVGDCYEQPVYLLSLNFQQPQQPSVSAVALRGGSATSLSASIVVPRERDAKRRRRFSDEAYPRSSPPRARSRRNVTLGPPSHAPQALFPILSERLTLQISRDTDPWPGKELARELQLQVAHESLQGGCEEVTTVMKRASDVLRALRCPATAAVDEDLNSATEALLPAFTANQGFH
eukprot:Hpha_TRINITY_DN23076_c0_g1::TRINITY_DN23076_c0_g1_i1::g.109231::m.109231